MTKKRFLNGGVLREVKNGRLNGSNKDVEAYAGTENITYTKKIKRSRETFPYASSQNQKKNLKGFAEFEGMNIAKVIAIDSKQAASDGNPYINYDEDVLGFMNACNLKLNEDQYNELSDDEKKGFSKKKKEYVKNVTKKRRSNFMLSPLQAIGDTKIVKEFCTRETDKTSLLYTKEVYSAYMSTGFNFDISNVGTFTQSTDESGFRDYAPNEFDNIELELSNEEKFKRVAVTLRGMQYYNSNICANNNAEDLSAKFIILADYRIGNNIFNNIFEDNKLKVEYLKEAIDENEEFRISDKIYIGVRSEFFKQDEKYLKEIVQEVFGQDDRFVVGSVKQVVDGYLQELSKNI